MTSAAGAGAIVRTLEAEDRAALVRADLVAFTMEVETGGVSEPPLGDAIRGAGISPMQIR
ncbi:MAG: copper chaperone [Burkholderiaceae bacterium]